MKLRLLLVACAIILFNGNVGAGPSENSVNQGQTQIITQPQITEQSAPQAEEESFWARMTPSTRTLSVGTTCFGTGLGIWLLASPPAEGESTWLPSKHTTSLLPIAFLYGLGVWLYTHKKDKPPVDKKVKKSLAYRLTPSYKTLAALSFGAAAGLSIAWLVNMPDGSSARSNTGGTAIPTTRFADFMPAVAPEIAEIALNIKNPARLHDLGASLPKGILLVGEPGVGKTMIARAIAGEAGVPFFVTVGSDYNDKWVASGASKVRKVWGDARNAAKKSEYKKAIIFIDEIDAVGGKRSNEDHGAAQSINGTVTALLHEMDGFATDETIFVVGATNRPEALDDALKRSGRFDDIIKIELPDADGRKALLDYYLAEIAHVEGLNTQQYVAVTEGWSGADIKSLMNKAVRAAARSGLKQVDATCLAAGWRSVVSSRQNGEGY